MPSPENPPHRHVAIFGGTGYIGTKLAIELYNAGATLTLFTRNPRKLSYLQGECELLKHKQSRFCLVSAEIDESHRQTIRDALEGVDAIYYLVHSLTVEKDSFLNKDNAMAALVATLAKEAGVKQIIYLGGLGVDRPDAPLSEHLKSRQQTGNYLRQHHPGVTEFRAGVIIGEGSASFELLRALGTKLPFLPALGAQEGYCQPIAVGDVTAYLLHALLNAQYLGQIVDIGCDTVLHYSDMLKIYATLIHKRPLPQLTLPFTRRLLTPAVMSWFASRLSGIPFVMIYRLLEGIDSYAIIDQYPVSKIDPECPVRPLSFEQSLKIAAQRSEQGYIISAWSKPYELSVFNAEKSRQLLSFSSQESAGLIRDEFVKPIPANSVDTVFDRVKDIGSHNGYYSTPWLWRVRGWIDRLLGGPGLNQCARSSAKLRRVGDRIDFWVVTYYRDTRYQKILRLKADMKMPGTGWLQFSIEHAAPNAKPLFIIRPFFDPRGIVGHIYWYALYFLHKMLFRQMLNNLTKDL